MNITFRQNGRICMESSDLLGPNEFRELPREHATQFLRDMTEAAETESDEAWHGILRNYWKSAQPGTEPNPDTAPHDADLAQKPTTIELADLQRIRLGRDDVLVLRVQSFDTDAWSLRNMLLNAFPLNRVVMALRGQDLFVVGVEPK